MTTFTYASSKLGNVHPDTRAKAREVFDAAKAAGHDIWFMWGMGSGEHATGRALDLMVRNKAAGDWVRAYVWRHRARLRLQHVIWRQHITSTTNTPGVARLMEDRGNTTANHYDHNHVLFNTGSYDGPSSTPSKGKKSTAAMASEVIAGKWGNGADRIRRLQAAGYNPTTIQNAVNSKMKGKPTAKKSTAAMASEVIAGKWGNGADRIRRLRAAGYNPTTIQNAVNARY